MATSNEIEWADNANNKPTMVGSQTLAQDSLFNPLWERGSKEELKAYLSALFCIRGYYEKGVIDSEWRNELIEILGLHEAIDNNTVWRSAQDGKSSQYEFDKE